MPDQDMREKVIKGLECCMIDPDMCDRTNCPYAGTGDESDYCDVKLIKDTIALMKAQEAVEPTLDIRHGKSMWRCGSCSTALQPNKIHTKFCFNCGRAVKWE